MEQFPGYLTEHANISPEDRARFHAQIACIKQLIDEFEAPTYRDDDEKARESIVALMSEVRPLSFMSAVLFMSVVHTAANARIATRGDHGSPSTGF